MTQGESTPPVPPPSGPDGGPAPLNYAGPEPDKDAKTMAMLAHLLGIFTGFLGSLLIWLIKKDSHPFIDDQGKEALNFQLTIIIVYIVGVATACLIIGWFIAMGAWIGGLVFSIIAAMKANQGIAYRYPFKIRFIK